MVHDGGGSVGDSDGTGAGSGDGDSYDDEEDNHTRAYPYHPSQTIMLLPEKPLRRKGSSPSA